MSYNIKTHVGFPDRRRQRRRPGTYPGDHGKVCAENTAHEPRMTGRGSLFPQDGASGTGLDCSKVFSLAHSLQWNEGGSPRPPSDTAGPA